MSTTEVKKKKIPEKILNLEYDLQAKASVMNMTHFRIYGGLIQSAA